MSTLNTFIQHRIGSPSLASGEEKEINGNQIGKEEIKLFRFAVTKKILKAPPKKWLGLSNEFGKSQDIKLIYRNLL